MTDPLRLSRHSKSGLGARLIASARDDDPPTSARHRALLALGASSGAVLTASVAEGGAALSGSAAAGASAGSGAASVASVASWSAAAKWVGGATVAAIMTAGAISRVHAPAPRVRPNAVALPAQNRSLEVPRVPAIDPDVRPIEAAPIPLHATPSKNLVRDSSRDTAGDSAQRAAAPVDLVGEVGVLDRAREAVAAGAGDRALAALDEYDRRFVAGTLTLESRVLRVEALAQKGDREKAARLAEAFLAQNPSSAHTARMRSLLGSIRNDRAP